MHVQGVDKSQRKSTCLEYPCSVYCTSRRFGDRCPAGSDQDNLDCAFHIQTYMAVSRRAFERFENVCHDTLCSPQGTHAALTSNRTSEATITRCDITQLDSAIRVTYCPMPASCATVAKKCMSSRPRCTDLPHSDIHSREDPQK